MAAAETIRHAALDLAINGAADFKQSMGEINRALKASQAELNKVTAAYGKNEQNVETLTAQKTHLTNAVKLNQEEQRRLTEELQRATEEYGENSREAQVLATKLGNVEAKGIGLERQLSEVTAALEEQERAIRGQRWTELGQKMEAAGEKMQAAGKRMQDVGKTMSLAVTAPIVAMGAAAIAVAADFDNSMGTVQARTGMTADEVHALSKEFRAMALSGDYGAFTAREIAAAYADVAVRGQDAEHATELMRMSMVLATAVGDDLGSTAAFLGEYLMKVGKDAGYAEKYINLFAAANQRTGIGLSTLQDYLFRTNAALQTAGISGTEATAVFSSLYAAGIKGAQAYSGMNTVIRDLITPSDDLVAIFDELGVSTFDITDANRNALDVLFELADAVEESGDALLRHNLLQELGTDMGTAFADELFTQRDALRELIPEMYELADATEGTGLAFEMAGIQQDGLIGTGQQVRATMEEIKLQIADHLMPHALRLAEAFSGLIQRFASLDEGTQRTIIKFAGVAAAIGPVLIIGGKLVATAGKITAGFGKMATAIGAAGGAKAYFTAKIPLLTTATAAYTAANTKLLAAMTGQTAATKAATTAFSIKATAMKGFTAVSAVVTGGLAAVKAAFIKLKAVMLANPLGLIIAGVAALAAGIAYLIIRVNRQSEAYAEMSAETERLVERQNQLAEASANAAERFQQNNAQMQDSNKHVREMADAVEYLTSKQELSAGEMEMLERYIAALNDSVPGLTLAIDENTGAMNMSADALNAYIRAAEKRAALDAQIEERMRLEREAIELQREAMTVAEQREALEEQLNDGTNRRRADRRALESAIQDLIAAEEGYNTALAANAEMQDALAESIDIYSQSLADLERTQREAAEAAAAIAEAMEDAEGSIDGVTDAVGRQVFSLEEWEKAQEDAVRKVTQSYERYYRVAANAFRTVTEAAAVSVTELTQNLQDNARAVEEWSKNIAILVERGVDEGLIQQLRDGGVEAAATVRELVNASDEELDALNTAFEESTRVALESMQRELDPTGVAQSAGELIDKVAEAILTNQSMEDALVDQINNAFNSLSDTVATIGFDEAGTNAVEGFTSGIDSMQGEVTQAGQDTGASYLDGLEGELEIRSPSRKTKKIAIHAGEGLIKGTKDIEPRVVDTARDLARAFIRGIADTIQQMPDVDDAVRRQIEDMRRIADMAVMNAHFDSIGQEMANGVARGINNGGGIVSNAAQNMINNALAAMRAAAAINSPSRKSMEIANHIGDGLIIRMKAKGKELVEVCKKITENVLDSLSVDPSGLIESAGSVLQGMQTAVPAMETHIRKAASPPPYASSAPAAPPSFTVNIHNPVIREESDIRKLARAVKKELLGDTDDESRIGGAILQP